MRDADEIMRFVRSLEARGLWGRPILDDHLGTYRERYAPRHARRINNRSDNRTRVAALATALAGYGLCVTGD